MIDLAFSSHDMLPAAQQVRRHPHVSSAGLVKYGHPPSIRSFGEGLPCRGSIASETVGTNSFGPHPLGTCAGGGGLSACLSLSLRQAVQGRPGKLLRGLFLMLTQHTDIYHWTVLWPCSSPSCKLTFNYMCSSLEEAVPYADLLLTSM